MKKLILAALLFATTACGASINHTHPSRLVAHDHSRATDTVTECTHTCIMDRHVCSMFTYTLTQAFNHIQEIETDLTEEDQAIMNFVHSVEEQHHVPSPEMIDALAILIPSISIFPVSENCTSKYNLCTTSCE